MLERVGMLLPEQIRRMLLQLPEDVKREICEIRLRKGGALSLTTYRKNLFFSKSGTPTQDILKGYVCDEKDINHVINRLCEGSVYRYTPSIRAGYIVTKEGIRAGVAGECMYDGDKISTISSFDSINIRIPREVDDAGDEVSRFLARNTNASVLLISPPGYGKTTVIRSVAKAVGTGKFGHPRRVAVIDERGEIFPNGAVGLAERFLGYKKSDGIEIATRVFSPELLVCDEIGQSDDTLALLSVYNSGVPVVATAHGESLDMVLKRPNIKRLVDDGVFLNFAKIVKGEVGHQVIFEQREL